MKKYIYTTIVLLTLLVLVQSCGTLNDPDLLPTAPTELMGTWYLTGSSWPNTDTLFFQRRDSMNLNEYGQRIEVYNDGKFLDTYTAWCGNDDNIHSTSGNWLYNEHTKIFSASIQICLKEKMYKIVSLSSSNLVFVKL